MKVKLKKNAEARLYEAQRSLVETVGLIPKALGSHYRVSSKEGEMRKHVRGGYATIWILSDCLGLNHSSATYKLCNLGQLAQPLCVFLSSSLKSEMIILQRL